MKKQLIIIFCLIASCTMQAQWTTTSNWGNEYNRLRATIALIIPRYATTSALPLPYNKGAIAYVLADLSIYKCDSTSWNKISATTDSSIFATKNYVGVNFWKLGSQDLGANRSIGATDSFGINFKTNNTIRFTIDATGACSFIKTVSITQNLLVGGVCVLGNNVSINGSVSNGDPNFGFISWGGTTTIGKNVANGLPSLKVFKENTLDNGDAFQVELADLDTNAFRVNKDGAIISNTIPDGNSSDYVLGWNTTDFKFKQIGQLPFTIEVNDNSVSDGGSAIDLFTTPIRGATIFDKNRVICSYGGDLLVGDAAFTINIGGSDVWSQVIPNTASTQKWKIITTLTNHTNTQYSVSVDCIVNGTIAYTATVALASIDWTSEFNIKLHTGGGPTTTCNQEIVKCER